MPRWQWGINLYLFRAVTRFSALIMAAPGEGTMPPTATYESNPLSPPASDAAPAAKGFRSVGSSLAARMVLSKKRRFLLKKEVCPAKASLPSCPRSAILPAPAVPRYGGHSRICVQALGSPS